MDDDDNNLPMGKLVTVEEVVLPPELSPEQIMRLQDPMRNPSNVERERIAELRRLERGQ